jgi:hypothetical protein
MCRVVDGYVNFGISLAAPPQPSSMYQLLSVALNTWHCRCVLICAYSSFVW